MTTVNTTNARMKPTDAKKISGSVLSHRNLVRFFPSAPISAMDRGFASASPDGSWSTVSVDCFAEMESWGFIRKAFRGSLTLT